MNPACSCLVYLVEASRDASNDPDDVQAQRTVIEDDMQAGPPQVDKAINGLKQGHNTYGEIGPVFLPHSDHLIPVLQCNWDFSANNDVLKLRVGLFKRDPSDNPGPLIATGLRFETPDHEPGGDHHLCHVQPIVSLKGPSGSPLPGTEADAVVESPTIPLPARNASELLTCLLISLYGRRKVADLSKLHFGDVLKTALRHAENASGFAPAP